MEMTLSLCTNCIHARTCVLRNGHAVQACEEHEVAQSSSSIKIKETFLPEREHPLKHFKGLCHDCEFAPHCTWKTEDSIVFNCEHYQ